MNRRRLNASNDRSKEFHLWKLRAITQTNIQNTFVQLLIGLYCLIVVLCLNREYFIHVHAVLSNFTLVLSEILDNCF